MNALRLASLLLAASAIPAAAIELSLEENRAERGSVGYVDMQQLFTASPDARRAKDSFEDLVRQAEEQVNARKAELLRLHQDLDGLKVERDSLAVSTPAAATPAPEPAPVKSIPAPAKPVVVPPAATIPPLAPVTAPAVPEPAAAAPLPAPEAPRPVRPPMLSINLPGLATGPLMLEPAAPEPPKPAAPEMPQPPASVAEPAPLPQPPAPEPEPAPAPAAAPAAPNLAQRLMEVDGLIAGKNADIARAEVELAKERLGAEKSLTEVEGRKTDQVLARLYRAISEVAKREGVSVVVEKTTILYGHNAVDLTDKVLKHLRASAPVPPQ